MTKRMVDLNLEKIVHNKIKYETSKICKAARKNKSRRRGMGEDRNVICNPSSVFGDGKNTRNDTDMLKRYLKPMGIDKGIIYEPEGVK